MQTPLKIFFVMVLATIPAAFALELTGHRNLAWAVPALGTPLAVTLMLWYVVLFDSKKRWPDLSLGERCAKVVFFER